MGVENPELFANLLEGDELARFFGQFVVPDSVRSGLPPATAARLPEDVAAVVRDTKAIWQRKGLLTPAELRSELLQTYLADAPPAIRTYLHDIELSRNTPEQVTGYLNKEHAYTGTGLSHMYARETGRPVGMIEVDFSNMGGTNDEFLRRMAAKQGIAIDRIPRFMAEQLTDRAVKLLASGMVHDLAGILPEGTRIIPIRTGGDEVRIMFDGPVPAGLADRLHAGIEQRVAQMGLQDHPHTKDPGNPARNGFGAAVTVRDLGTITNPEHLSRILDDEIRHAKNDLGQKRREGPQADALRAQNPMHNPALLQGLDGFNRYVDTTLPTLNVPDLLHPGYLPFSLAGQIPAGRYRSDGVAPLATLDRRRFALAQADLERQGITLNDLEGHFLRQSIVGMTPVDPAAQVHMPKDMVGLIEVYAKESEDYRGQFNPGDPVVKKALADAGLVSLAEVKPQGMAVSYHGLASLNNVLGHHQADLVLRHLGRDIIGDSFRAAGVPADARPPYTIAHHGGGNFSVVVQSGTRDAQGHPVFMSPDRMKVVSDGIMQRLDDLNARPVADFLAQRGVQVDAGLQQRLQAEGVRTFADLPDSKVRNVTVPDGTKVQGRVCGLMAVTTALPIEPGMPATHVLGHLRNTADARMDTAREERIRASPQAQPVPPPPPQPETQPLPAPGGEPGVHVPSAEPASVLHVPVSPTTASVRNVLGSFVPTTKGNLFTTGVLALAAGVGAGGYNLWQGRGLDESAQSAVSVLAGFVNPAPRATHAIRDDTANGYDVATALAEDTATFGGATAGGVWAGTQLGAVCLPGGPLVAGGCAIVGGLTGGFLGAAAVEQVIDKGRFVVDATGRFIGETWDNVSGAFNALVSGESEQVDTSPLQRPPSPETNPPPNAGNPPYQKQVFTYTIPPAP